MSDAYSFLFYSSPSTGTIHAARVLTAVEQSQNAKMESKKLLGLETIPEPRGLAVDSLRKILYIVDGNAGQGSKLYAARIYDGKHGSVSCEAPVLIAENLASHWVAVDFRGKVFFVSGNQIWSATVALVMRKLDGGSAVVSDSTNEDSGDAAQPESTIVTGNNEANPFLAKGFEMVYNGDGVSSINVPHGLAVDGYRLFWSNGENGKQDGTIVSGLESPMGGTDVSKIATNLPAAFGVCITPQRVYYTDAEANVFSTKVNGGPVVTVTDKLQKPRGCVFDGDGTVFIADSGAKNIVSFAGAAAELGPRKLSLALGDIDAPFGLAVLLGKRDGTQSGSTRSTITMVVAIFTALMSFMH